MDRHIVIGTAGHVDHGKTLLTAALTGIDTDRLPEEKRRGMTIVPGYVALELPNGLKLGLVDVPGHEKFIKNMLAGVGGIDMALLVVAADEGVMPQTVEHLNILHLLGVRRGVVAITKCDMVEDDEEWLEMVHEQVRKQLSRTLLHDAPIVDVSAATGYHIEQLKDTLAAVAGTVKERPPVGFSRLPVDRCFTKKGFGTIVTGTLWAGAISVGQRLEVLPQGRELRVRGIQVHGQAVERALAGQRTALNLVGDGAEDLSPGCWLAEKSLLRPSLRMDVKLDLLPDAGELSQRARVHLFHGTAQVSARVRFLDRETLRPGMSCLCQLELEKALPPLRGDRLILRSWSPEVTVAGATVLDADAPRYKLSDPNTMRRIAAKDGRDDSLTILDLLDREAKPIGLAGLKNLAQMTEEDTSSALAQLMEQKRAVRLEADPPLWLSAELYERWPMLLGDTLRAYHEKYPLRRGCPIAELRTEVFGRIQTKHLSLLLFSYQARGDIRVDGAVAALPGFAPCPDERQQQELARIAATYRKKMFIPPVWQELMASFHIADADAREYLPYLLDRSELERIENDYFCIDAVSEAARLLEEQYDAFTVSQARDVLGTTRKYALPLLGEMDRRGITVREGEGRRFRSAVSCGECG